MRFPSAFVLLGSFAMAALLVSCAYIAPKYTVTQYNSDGTVLNIARATGYSAGGGGCISYRITGEPTQTLFHSCGSVVGETDVPTNDDAKARFVVTQYRSDGKELRRWTATSITSTNGGCIGFTASGDPNNTRLACGNVVAEARMPAPSPASPAPYQVTIYRDDGSVLKSWRVKSYSLIGGVITFVVAGDASNSTHYVVGNVQAGTEPN